jgi:hypothetical protein
MRFTTLFPIGDIVFMVVLSALLSFSFSYKGHAFWKRIGGFFWFLAISAVVTGPLNYVFAPLKRAEDARLQSWAQSPTRCRI